MREKKLQCVITFKTTTQAMAFEEVAQAQNLSGRLIPLPRSLGAGCGMAWKENIEEQEYVNALLEQFKLEYESIHQVLI